MRPKSSCFALGKSAAQAGIVGQRLLGDGAHDRHQLGAQLVEQRAHAGHRHALVGAVDQRIGDVVVGAEIAGVLAAEIQRLLQEGAHGREVVGRPRPRPGVVGGRAHLARSARRNRRAPWWPSRSRAGRRGSGWRRRSRRAGSSRVGGEAVEQPAERRIGELLVRQPAAASRPGARARRRRPSACRWPGPSRARRRQSRCRWSPAGGA